MDFGVEQRDYTPGNAADEALRALHNKVNDGFKSYCDVRGENLPSHFADGAWTQ